MAQPKQVDLNNPLVKRLVELKLGIPKGFLKYFVLPQEGDKITLGNIVYRIVYIRENPFRFSAEPVAILQDEELEKLNPELAESQEKKE